MAAGYLESEQHAAVIRQSKVAQLRLAGLTNQTRIAEILQVNQSAISTDFRIIDQIWQERAQQDIATAKGLDIERCERLIAACWPKAMSGHTPSVKVILDVMIRRAKLLGLDAPITINDVTGEVRRLSAEFGMDVSEIMAEAQRIIQIPQRTPMLVGASSTTRDSPIDEFP